MTLGKLKNSLLESMALLIHRERLSMTLATPAGLTHVCGFSNHLSIGLGFVSKTEKLI